MEYLQVVVSNPLHTDVFGPSDSRQYFSFAEFGIREQDMIWIDSKSPYLKAAL